MSPSVSPELAKSLDNLNRTLEAAENALRKIPGSEQTQVDITTANTRWNQLSFSIEPVDAGGGLQVSNEEEWRHLSSEPAVVRIAVAEFVPHLIDAAVEGQSEAARRADDAAGTIEARLLSELENEWPGS